MSNLPVDLVDALVVDSITRTRAIQERSAVLAYSEYASTNPQKYASLLGKIAKSIDAKLRDLRVRVPDDPDAILDQVRIVDGFVQDLAADIRYVEAAASQRLPWSLSKPFEQLLNTYLPDRTIMLRPQWKHNYSIHIHDLVKRYSPVLRDLLEEKEVKEIFSDVGERFHIVSFPAVERKNALLHCDLAHEIGHLVAEEYLENESRDYLYEFQEPIAKQVHSDATIPPLWRPVAIAQRIQQTAHIRRRALEELVSDIFGIRVLGPAAMFAMVSFAVGQKMDIGPDTRSGYYPPWRTRIRYMLTALDKSGFLPIRSDKSFSYSAEITERVNARMNDLRTLVNVTSDRDAIEANELSSLAYGNVERTLPAIIAHLDERYADRFLTPDALFPEVYQLIDRLVQGVTPNEVTNGNDTGAATLEAILNAAWFYRIGYLTDPLNPAEDQLALPVLNRLTLKAAELAQVQREFDAAVDGA